MTQLATIDDATPEGPARARLGATSLIIALVPTLWVAGAATLIAASVGSNDTLAELATLMFFASFAVVPIFSLLAVVLGILALLVNRRVGKLLGGVAILVIILEIVAITVLIGGSFDLAAQSLGA